MLADIRPLLSEEVYHHYVWARDVYGKPQHYREARPYAARIIYSEGRQTGPASGEKSADPKATLWLLNHPVPIRINDQFELPSGETLAVLAAERRIQGGDTLHKVYLT